VGDNTGGGDMKKPTWKMPTRNAPQRQGPRWSWKRVLLVVVGLLVAFMIGRTVLSGFNTGAVDVTGQGEAPEGQTKSASPKPTVEISGSGVPAGAGPVAVLNPGFARPGARVGVNATGFDPGATVEVLLSAGPGAQPAVVATAEADTKGVVNTEFAVPVDAANAAPTQAVTVQQANSDKSAKAELVAQAGVGTVKLSDDTGAPGAVIGIDAEGFVAGEQVNVYWGRAGGPPAATLTADSAGRISKEEVKVGVAPAGDSTLVMIGDQSKTTATTPFTMLGLYPTAESNPYAVRAGDTTEITAGGFAPDERVLVHFNESGGAPPIVLQADEGGSVSGVGLKVPFGLKGQQTLILTGEQSRASVSSGFTVLPYNPTARANTYGGLPGTTLTFYGRDFAPNEVVKVYAGAGENTQGELVTAFRVDGRGAASAAGSYVIPGDAQGELTFSLVGSKSEGSSSVTVTVDPPDGPVNVAPQPEYTLPPELQD
jgi:hypothetical protein